MAALLVLLMGWLGSDPAPRQPDPRPPACGGCDCAPAGDGCRRPLP